MTDKEIQEVINSMVVIVDTREKKNKHILDYLTEIGVKYEIKKLDSGDYSFEVPNYPELNNTILIERKNSWDEIIGNLTSNRERFAREFERIGDNQKLHIMIEGATWKQASNGTYRSKVPSKSLLASIFTWNARYNSNVWLVTEKEFPLILHQILYYGLREKLKNI